MRQEDERDGEPEEFSFEKDVRGKEQQLKALSYLIFLDGTLSSFVLTRRARTHQKEVCDCRKIPMPR